MGGLVLGLLMVFWLPGELLMGNYVMHVRGRIDLFHFPAILEAFPAAWLALWTITGFGLIRGCLLAFWSRQQLIVGPSRVTLRTTLFGRSRAKEFPIAQIQNVRIVSARGIQVLGSAPGQAQEATVGQSLAVPAGGTPIAFDVGGKAYRFGRTLSAETVRTIQDTIERSRRG